MLVLIDSNFLAYYYSFRNRHFSHAGAQTNIVFGFLKTILSLSKTFDTDRFAFCWDSRRSIRKVFFPEYKKSREKTEEELLEMAETFRQMTELRTRILPGFGFRNVFQKTGYEGDDIIGRICLDNPGTEICMVSNDNDLYQLLSDNHFMYDIGKKTRYTKLHFTHEYGIPPERWAEVKSLAGCQGDGVPGVPGVGITTAIKHVKGMLPPRSKALAKIESAKADGLVAETLRLVELPLPGLGLLRLEEAEVFELEGFQGICDGYGFRSLAAQEPVWREQFNMSVREV